jgi:hypothetical protein
MNECEFKKAQQCVAEIESIQAELASIHLRGIKHIELHLTVYEKSKQSHGQYLNSGYCVTNNRLMAFMKGSAIDWCNTRITHLKEELLSLGVEI